MVFPIPDLKAMAQRTKNAFRADLKGSDAWLWPNNIVVTSKVFAGTVWELFCKLKEIDKQRFPDTATGEGLTHWGKIYSIGRKGASQAQGYVDVPAVYPFTVPISTPFERSDGYIYTTTKSVDALQYATGFVTVPVVCSTAGKLGNCLAGTPLTSTLQGLTGDTTTVSVNDAGIGLGADIESPAAFQARILARIRQPPMGGASYDYDAWAKDVSGVTRVFVSANAYGKGTVGVLFLMDDTYPQGIPQAADVAAVQAYLDLVKPTAATVIVTAPVAVPIDVIVSKVSPATQAVYQSVAAELLALFSSSTTPGLPDKPFVLYHSRVEQAVDNATGEDFNDGVLQPAADISFSFGLLPVINSVSFTDQSALATIVVPTVTVSAPPTVVTVVEQITGIDGDGPTSSSTDTSIDGGTS